MAMRPYVSYIPYAPSSKEHTCNIITCVQFEEGGVLSETNKKKENVNKSDDNSTLAPSISEE